MRIQTEELLASSKSARLRKKQKSSLEKNEHIAGWLFVAPMLIGVFMFVLLPIAATFVLSMTDWKFVQSMDQLKWVGFGNFTELMSDRVF